MWSNYSICSNSSGFYPQGGVRFRVPSVVEHLSRVSEKVDFPSTVLSSPLSTSGGGFGLARYSQQPGRTTRAKVTSPQGGSDQHSYLLARDVRLGRGCIKCCVEVIRPYGTGSISRSREQYDDAATDRLQYSTGAYCPACCQSTRLRAL